MNKLNNFKTAFYSTLIVGFFLLFWWLGDGAPKPSTQGKLDSSGPDYSMTGFTVYVMDEHGKLSYKLFAEQMNYFTSQELALLDRPIVEFYANAQPRWNLDAVRGRIEGSDTVWLEDEVHLRHEDMNQQTDMVAKNMYIYTQAKKLYTASEIQITNPSGKINAVGLQADFRHNLYSLLSRVQSEYYMDIKK